MGGRVSLKKKSKQQLDGCCCSNYPYEHLPVFCYSAHYPVRALGIGYGLKYGIRYTAFLPKCRITTYGQILAVYTVLYGRNTIWYFQHHIIRGRRWIFLSNLFNRNASAGFLYTWWALTSMHANVNPIYPYVLSEPQSSPNALVATTYVAL